MLTSQQIAYMRWLALPDEHRALSEAELLELLCGPEADRRTFSGWRKSKEFQRALDKRIREQDDSADYLSYAMREQTKQQVWHEFKALSAKENKDKDDHVQLRNYGEQIMKMTAHVEKAGDDLPPYEDLPDDELVALFLDTGLSLASATQNELARIYDELKGEPCPTQSSVESSPPSSSPQDSTQVGSTATEQESTVAKRRSPKGAAAGAKSSSTS
jgi:hypothetical protein